MTFILENIECFITQYYEVPLLFLKLILLLLLSVMPPKKDSKKQVKPISYRHRPNPIIQEYLSKMFSSKLHSLFEVSHPSHPPLPSCSSGLLVSPINLIETKLLSSKVGRRRNKHTLSRKIVTLSGSMMYSFIQPGFL